MARTITVARLVVPVVSEVSGLLKGFKTAGKAGEQLQKQLVGAAKIATAGLGLVTAAAVGTAAGLLKLANKAKVIPGILQAFNTRANATGVSLDALRSAAQGTVTDLELMRVANVALTGAGEELGKAFGRDLPLLLEGARAAARATGKDAALLFDKITNGVKKTSPLLIDDTGLVLKLGEANQKMADDMGIAVTAMTAEQKQLAILAATGDAVRRMLSELGEQALTSAERIVRVKVAAENLTNELAMSLLPALDRINDTFFMLINKIAPPLVDLFENKIGPALAVLADGFGALADKAFESGSKLVNQYGSQIARFVKDAVTWGVNLATEFARGFIQGASQAVVTAMNFLASLLTFWMGPGSPPRVAADADKWGTLTADEFLGGFSDADYDLLEGFQSGLESAFGALVKAGELAAGQAATVFRDLTLQFGQAVKTFRKTGRTPVALFDQIREAGGRLGGQLENLARAQFKVALGAERYLKAEERLQRALAGKDKAQSNLTRIMDEYNQMLAEGASAEDLAAKRAEFDTAKKRLKNAEAEVGVAEKQEKAAKRRLDPMRKQLRLQERMLEQLTKLMGEQQKAAEPAAAAALGGKGVGGLGALPEIKRPTIPAPDTSALDTAFEEAKEEIRLALEEAFKPFTDMWNEEMPAAMERITKSWDGLKESFDKFWTHPAVVKVREWLAILFPDVTVENVGKAAGVLTVLAIAFKILKFVMAPVIALVSALVSALGVPLTLLIAAVGVLVYLLIAHGPTLERIVKQLAFIMMYFINEAAKMVKWLWDLVKIIAAEIWRRVMAFFLRIGTTMGQLIAIVVFYVGKAIGQAQALWDQVVLIVYLLKLAVTRIIIDLWFKAYIWWTRIKTAAIKIWKDLKEGIEEKILEAKTFVEEKIEAIKTFIEEFDLKQVGIDLIAGLLNGINEKIGEVREAIVGAIGGAIEGARKKLRGESPSRVFMEMGRDAMEGLALGVTANARMPAYATAAAMQQTIDNSRAVTYNNTLNVQTRATTSTYLSDYYTVAALSG